MQNKLIEYMACIKAVVASSVANEGIMAPENALIIANTPDSFAEAVIRLLGDTAATAELGASARSYVLSNWTCAKHFLDLEDAFCSALDERSGDVSGVPSRDRSQR